MKKLVFFLFLIISINIYSQQHLKMFGIPLDGSITNFTNKLALKEIVINKEVNKLLPVGIRGFKGSFAGYITDNILIMYNPKSKNVYRGLVNFSGLSDDTFVEMFNDIKRRITEKYKYTKITESIHQNGFPVFECVVYLNSNRLTVIGTIKMGIIVPENKIYDNTLYIGYDDKTNSELFQNSLSDDL